MKLLRPDWRVPLRRRPDHQGAEGAPQGQEEGEEHQARRRHHHGRHLQCRARHQAQVPRNQLLRNCARGEHKLFSGRCFNLPLAQVLGTAQSVGCTIDGEDPHDLIEQIQCGDLECPDE